MHRLAPLVAFTIFSLASPALADVPNDPCMNASVGDACMTTGGDDGACVEVSGANFLTCEAGAAPSTSSGGTSGDGDDDGEDDDGGCSVGGDGGTLGWAALGMLLALRRWR